MTWQDDLRQLDEELSSGQLSAEDYRRRRDELLARQAPEGAEGAVPATPFPPPFRWEIAVPDDTQVVQPIRDDAPPSDATQVVSGTGELDSDRTQVVSGGPAPPAGFRDPQGRGNAVSHDVGGSSACQEIRGVPALGQPGTATWTLSLIHISEPTRPY